MAFWPNPRPGALQQIDDYDVVEVIPQTLETTRSGALQLDAKLSATIAGFSSAIQYRR
jgi:hypothetical protein